MYTGLQIINEIEDRLGWPQSSTLEGVQGTKTRKLVRLLNRVLKNLVAAEQWPLLRQEGHIMTQAAIEDEMLLILVKGSTTVTISPFDTSGVTFAEQHKTWALQVTPSQPIYRIAEVVLPRVVTLNKPWMGDSVTPASALDTPLSVKMAQDRYALPDDFDRPFGSWQDMLSAHHIKATGPEKFGQIRRARGTVIELGDPQFYTVWGLDDTNTYQVLHLDPWPLEQTLLQYPYQRVHPEIETDDDRVLFPQPHMSIVIEVLLRFANRDYEDDTRMQDAMQEYLRQFNAVKGNNSVVQDVKQFVPDRFRARSVRTRRSYVAYDYGDYFDRVSSVDIP
jgi:hypothetical protein